METFLAIMIIWFLIFSIITNRAIRDIKNNENILKNIIKETSFTFCYIKRYKALTYMTPCFWLELNY